MGSETLTSAVVQAIRSHTMNRSFLLSLCACGLLHACSSSRATGPARPSGTADSGIEPLPGDGGTLRVFVAPPDPGPGGVLLTASGEALALTGYPFPPARGGVGFVDGWEVTFRHLVVTLDRITISENPDAVVGDQSKTGAVVAEADGPWAIDLARRDASDVAGKGGGAERAVPFAALYGQNRNGDQPFATDGRYAFGFDVVPARSGAYDVNLGDAASDYARMIDDRCVVLYVGTATFKGDKSDTTNCYPPSRRNWPDSVDFRFCFRSPASYVNCQNPDNDPATPLAGEEHERGIAFRPNEAIIAQVTIHTDHPFWDSVVHDSPTHFDQFAARVVGEDAAVPEVTLEATQGVDYTAYTDALGVPLDWRYCIEPPTDAHRKFVGAMRFDPGNVPHAVGDDPSTGLRDYYDFATYDQSTQGHLNSDGLCFVKRNYRSPL